MDVVAQLQPLGVDRDCWSYRELSTDRPGNAVKGCDSTHLFLSLSTTPLPDGSRWRRALDISGQACRHHPHCAWAGPKVHEFQKLLQHVAESVCRPPPLEISGPDIPRSRMNWADFTVSGTLCFFFGWLVEPVCHKLYPLLCIMEKIQTKAVIHPSFLTRRKRCSILPT